MTVSGSAKIEKNNAVNGGGIYVSEGDLNLSGNATITQNTATTKGGGVYYIGGSAKMTVSGSVQIIGNTGAGGKANNVYVPNTTNTDGCHPFTIGEGGLGGDAKIGITYGGTIELGKCITVALHAERGYKDGNFTSDSSNSAYSFKREADHEKDSTLRGTHVVNLYNGLHEHPICGKTCNHTGSEKHTDNLTWTGVSSLSEINKAGNYYLTKDVETSGIWEPTNGVNLCLNGHSITVTADEDAIHVNSGTFTLTDCDGSKGSKTFKKDSTSGQWEPDTNGNITVSGGIITHASGKGGGGVEVKNGAAFTMYGGTICGNSNLNGGGVYSMGTFDLYGGKIAGNAAAGNYSQGGGVFTGGKFHMYGGEITDNKADNGGGVYLSGSSSSVSSFTMEGGTISGNNAANNGGGVYVHNSGAFTMKKGTIGGSTTDDANTAGSGGGVCVTGGMFNMNGGKVAGNTATSGHGGGVEVSDGAFTMEGGSITGNDVTYTGNGDKDHFGHGGGVYVNKNAKQMIVSGKVQIENNWKDGTLNTEKGVYEQGSGSANNLYLFANDSGTPKVNKTVAIGEGGLNGNAKIGVTTRYTPENKGGKILIATGAQTDHTGFFTPDVTDKGYTIKQTGTDLYLSAHEHSWKYEQAANGMEIVVSCDAGGCNLNGQKFYYILSAPTDLTYNGKGKPASVSDPSNVPAGVTLPVVPTISYTYMLNNNPTTLSPGEAPISARTYYASITMGEGTNKATASVTYTIGQATPEYTAPTNLTTVYGKTLADVALPTGWTWKDASQSVGNVGTNTFKATYTPSDANYHAISDIDITVTVDKAPVTITISGMPNGPISYGDTFVLTITQTGDDNAVPANWTNFSHDQHLKYLREKSDPENGKFMFRANGFCNGYGCSGEFTATFESATHKGSLTVDTPNITKKTLTADDLVFNGLPTSFTKVYDGSKSVTRVEAVIKSTAKVNAGDTLPTVTGTYAYDSKDVKDASKVTFTSQKTENENYILPAGLVVEREATITPATITVTPDAKSKTYNTTPMADPELTYTYTGAQNGETPAFTGVLERAEGENVGSYIIEQGTLKLANGEGFKASNYTLIFSTTPVYFTINKATYGDKIASGSAMYGNAGSVDLSDWIKDGATVALGTVTDTSNVLKADSVSLNNSNILHFAFEDKAENKDKKVTVEVNVTGATNYEDYTITVTLTVDDKLVPQGEPTLSATEITYGEKLGTIKITGTMKHGDDTIEGTLAWDTPDEDEVLDAGEQSVTWTFTPKDTLKYATVTGTTTITVKQATPTGEPGYTKITSRGRTLADVGLTAMDGETSRFKYHDEEISGDIYFVDDNGNQLDMTTPVESGKAYKWIFAPSGDYVSNYESVSGTITPWVSSGIVIVPSYPTDSGNVSNPSTGAAPQGGIACGVAVLAAGICLLGAKRKNHE